MTQLRSSTQEISTVAARSADNMRTQQDELNMLAAALNRRLGGVSPCAGRRTACCAERSGSLRLLAAVYATKTQ